jgi:segregation and condensation protein B
MLDLSDGLPSSQRSDTGPVSNQPADLNSPESIGADEWSGSDIEEAYQRALAAVADVAWPQDSSDGSDGSSVAVQDAPTDETATAPSDSAADRREPQTDPEATGPRLATGTEPHQRVAPDSDSPVTAAQVIEAAMFVGGVPLTAKKLCTLLRGSFDVPFVERTIDELNEQYAGEVRPYEIRLGNGGYRLELRPEFEKVRQRVYGAGPREVKLSQDALEVLALVAYQQPITQQEIESHGKQNGGNLLRQLLRRDLIAIERTAAGGRKNVAYRTTPRFLTLFGLGSLDELPQPDDLVRK